MLNKLWGIMLLAGIIVAAFTGKTGEVGTAAIDSSKEAVTLCIAMLGVMSMWTGIMNVAKRAGLIDAMTKALRPALRFLFPDIPEGHVANEYISANMIANMLGLGWAATPYGLKAMEQMKELNGDSRVASADMCTFLIINISSLQLIPGEHYRIPEPVWGGVAYVDHWHGACSYAGFDGGGHHICHACQKIQPEKKRL